MSMLSHQSGACRFDYFVYIARACWSTVILHSIVFPLSIMLGSWTSLCVCVCVCERECVCVCVRERERVSVCVYGGVCLCVCVRACVLSNVSACAPLSEAHFP